jgi:hypothetical protein
MKKNKYFAKKTKGSSGKIYDSKKESIRAYELKLLERAGNISNLQEQVPFVILATFKDSLGKTERGIKYIADFTYTEDGKNIIEDLKSKFTAKLKDYIIKRKLIKSLYPDHIFREVIK